MEPLDARTPGTATPLGLRVPCAGIGAARSLADLGQEMPTALLRALLTSTLGALPRLWERSKVSDGPRRRLSLRRRRARGTDD